MTAKNKMMMETHPLLSDRIRLSVMGILATSDESVSFNDLLEALDLTKGNLSAHMKKLEDEKLVIVNKQFIDRKPRTSFECTLEGRAALKQYLEQVESLLRGSSR